MTPSGIELATFRLVAQCLNQTAPLRAPTTANNNNNNNNSNENDIGKKH